MFLPLTAKAKASRNADGTEHISKAFILAGLGALLAIAAGVALICYYEHGTLSAVKPAHRLNNGEIYVLIYT